jgi:hypothetical protein
MNAAEIAANLGPARRSGGWWRTVCPIHGSRTGRSLALALRDTDRGLALYCHAGCARADIMAELWRRSLLDGPAEYRPPPAAPAVRVDDAARRIELAQRTWGGARDARGTPVAAYLAGRGLTLPVPLSLRYAPALRRPDGTSGPAMLGRIDDIDGRLIGITRTWIARGPDGVWRRRDRAMLGRAKGGAARLAPAAETLLVGEGIETCLAAMQATGLPAWAALSTSGMTALILPGAVRDVVIAADQDRSGAGERAARNAAARWRAEGRRVRIYISPRLGEDVADLILAAAIEARHAA